MAPLSLKCQPTSEDIKLHISIAYGVMSCGGGKRKDVVKQCLELGRKDVVKQCLEFGRKDVVKQCLESELAASVHRESLWY